VQHLSAVSTVSHAGTSIAVKRVLLLGAIAIAGCGDQPKPAATRDATAEWAAQVNAACKPHIAEIERLRAAVLSPSQPDPDRAIARYSASIESLYEDLKAVERPKDDRRVQQYVSAYATVITYASMGDKDINISHDYSMKALDWADGFALKAHLIGEKLGAETCTGWLPGA
jgi:hypothetical protein